MTIPAARDSSSALLLAGDVGGTKTHLGLFARAPRRPVPVAMRTYRTSEFSSFSDILRAFGRDVPPPAPIEAGAVGVAGPVVNQHATLTNVAFDIAAEEISGWCGTGRAALLNDLQAMAYSVDVLTSDEMVELQPGEPREGNAVVVAAGTGLGAAYLFRKDGRLHPSPAEAGHADFAARTDREIELLRMLRREFGRAEVEHVLCGPGIVNLHRFTHGGASCPATAGEPAPRPAAISDAAMRGACPHCEEAMAMFVAAYGAEAGNLALRGLTTGGVYIGGGIAPKILPLLQRGSFVEAFRAKPPMTDLLVRMPIRVILNAQAGVLGAAVYANDL